MYHFKLKWKLFSFRNLSQEQLKSYAMLRGTCSRRKLRNQTLLFCKTKYMIVNRIEICKQGSILCLIKTTTCKNSDHLSLHTHKRDLYNYETLTKHIEIHRECKNISQNALHGNQSHID